MQSVEDHRRGRNVDTGWVESSFLLAVVDGAIVGRSSIRHELNEYLLEGGHIGYAVRPPSPPWLRHRDPPPEPHHRPAFGVERALVTCDDDNVASAAVIESCGGVLERRPADRRRAFRRYWIE